MKDQAKHKASRRKGKVKIRGDTNEIEKRKQWRKSIKPFGFKKKINEIGKYLKR